MPMKPRFRLERWPHVAAANHGAICLSTQLSGINDQSIHEIVWYARDFEVPQEWREQDVLLHFGAVDYRCTVWLNGEEVGHNQGGHVPFSFDIAPYLREDAIASRCVWKTGRTRINRAASRR
jgi:beta-galactosidase/beta-glucuronidase